MTEERWLLTVRQAQARDSAAMIALLQEFDNLLQAAVRRYAPRSPHERGDLMQEAHIGFLKAVLAYRPEHGVTFAAYAKIKTQEAVWQAVRRTNRIREREVEDRPLTEDEGGSASTLLDACADPRTEAAFCELEWRSLLASLSEREALAVEKLVIDGFTLAELARLEGVSPGTVKTWKQRAFIKIREELKKTRG
jgi:RNA polymerase sigma factor (sigma-70 family)